MVDAYELGKEIGKQLKEKEEYKQDFVENDNLSDLNIVGIESEGNNNYKVSRKKFVTTCSVTGVNGGVDPFVLDHVVNGNLDSASFYIDGDYCNSYVYDSDASITFNLVDESGNLVIGTTDEYVIYLELS